MGYGVETMAVFQTIARDGFFDDIKRVVDLGSQEMHFSERDTTSHPYREIIRSTVVALGGPELSESDLAAMADRASVGEFYRLLGKEYKALDADGWYGPPFDINLDQVMDEDRGAYCLTVNSGTTEHLVDQRNAFCIVHDLTRAGGLMIHSVPFVGSIDHGFFNYNPNFFRALARFNSYEVLGLWVMPYGIASLIPWNENTSRYLELSGRGNSSLYCLLRKEYDQVFCTPFQNGYEGAQAESNLDRYNYVIDGNLISGVEAYRISQQDKSIGNLTGRTLLRELKRRIMRRFHLSD